MENKCICCGAEGKKTIFKEVKSIYTNTPYALEECTICGHTITLPKPDKNLIANIYDETYLYSVHKKIIKEKKFRARKTSDFIEKNNLHLKRIIELGTNFGFLLEILSKKYKVSGIEIDTQAVNYCNSLNLDVTQSSVEDYLERTENHYDLVIISHVLEHLYDVESVINGLKKILQNGGYLLILVPNKNSFTSKIFGKYWGWWQVPVHINHFTTQSLQKILEKHNFTFINKKLNGGDSLMLLLNMMNLINFRADNSKGSIFTKLLPIYSFFYKYWYYFSNEEIVMLFKNDEQNCNHAENNEY